MAIFNILYNFKDYQDLSFYFSFIYFYIKLIVGYAHIIKSEINKYNIILYNIFLIS